MGRSRNRLACRSWLSGRRWVPSPAAGTAAIMAIGAVLPAGAARSGSATDVVIQPAPPVSAAAFPIEPRGRFPADGDGLIPNPATPAGIAAGPPSACTVRFAASGGGNSAAANSWISAHQNAIRATTVVCLSGTFTSPIHVWGKTSTALLELAPAPGSTATLDLGPATAADINPNEYWGDAGGVSIVDSRSVEVYGLTVKNYAGNGTGPSPAGIFVTVRSDTAQTDQSVLPHLSACFVHGGSCSDIYLIGNKVKNIVNTADENYSDQSVCGDSNVNAYGIAAIAAGSSSTQALQHLVIEGNTVSGTRTGRSETVTINGDITDFLAAGNVIHDTDNIGLDTIGWATGSAQASHGYLTGNTVYNVDTYSNAAYGTWQGGSCVPGQENAAGIYDDGGSYIWISANTVRNADHGIEAGVEAAGRQTDHILISGNSVVSDPGTSASDPSAGRNPAGTGGSSAVAGHDPFALYLDAYGAGAQLTDVYVHDNTLQNQSQFFMTPSWGMPVADIAGIWSRVQVWHNTITGLGPADRHNPLLQIDSRPADGGTGDVLDCNNYQNLTTAAQAVNGNFAMPGASWLALSGWQQWQEASGYGWDQHSAVGTFSPACPASSLP
jgi:hypothetical protein